MADPQVNPPSPNLRFMIAGHSPQGFLESRTVHCGSREKPGNRGPTSRTVCSLQSGLSGKIAKYWHYLRISAESEWNFCAVQTAWRRGRDSNPRYRSETCKSRRLRKLRGIKSFKNSLRLPASRGVVANRWGFEGIGRRILAILWLKLVTSKL
jgi:hypothetical protein